VVAAQLAEIQGRALMSMMMSVFFQEAHHRLLGRAHEEGLQEHLAEDGSQYYGTQNPSLMSKPRSSHSSNDFANC
jgi:hypothetical protein